MKTQLNAFHVPLALKLRLIFEKIGWLILIRHFEIDNENKTLSYLPLHEIYRKSYLA